MQNVGPLHLLFLFIFLILRVKFSLRSTLFKSIWSLYICMLLIICPPYLLKHTCDEKQHCLLSYFFGDKFLWPGWVTFILWVISYLIKKKFTKISETWSTFSNCDFIHLTNTKSVLNTSEKSVKNLLNLLWVLRRKLNLGPPVKNLEL